LHAHALNLVVARYGLHNQKDKQSEDHGLQHLAHDSSQTFAKAGRGDRNVSSSQQGSLNWGAHRAGEGKRRRRIGHDSHGGVNDEWRVIERGRLTGRRIGRHGRQGIVQVIVLLHDSSTWIAAHIVHHFAPFGEGGYHIDKHRPAGYTCRVLAIRPHHHQEGRK
jgi:hypothetical protein